MQQTRLASFTLTKSTSSLPSLKFLSRRLTLKTIWLLVVPIALFAGLSLVTIDPNDFWWHVRMGGIILHQHAMPTTDHLPLAGLAHRGSTRPG